MTTAGTVKSPNYPSAYPGYVKCHWLIKAPAGMRIRITVSNQFKVSCDYYATYGPCDQDWLEIRNKINAFELGGPR